MCRRTLGFGGMNAPETLFLWELWYDKVTEEYLR